MTTLLALWLAPDNAIAQYQINGPLHVGNSIPVTDEFGQVLPGQASQPGCLVMVLQTTNGVIYPPDVNGQPDPRNPLLPGGTAGIGKLARRDATRPGVFGMAMPRPADGAKLFVRIFNSSNTASASFYGDSALFTVNANVDFNANITATTLPLDAGDDDGDGLNNSWEKSYGSNSSASDSDGDGLSDLDEHNQGLHPALADTDGDGMPDGSEVRAGTDAANPSSYLGVGAMQPTDNDLVVQWSSVTGKQYQVEYTTTDLAQPTSFTPLSGLIPASTGNVTYTVLTNAMQLPGVNIYRIRLIE